MSNLSKLFVCNTLNRWCAGVDFMDVSLKEIKKIQETNNPCRMKRAATWQNQQTECVPSEDSDEPGHPPSLIRVFAIRMRKPWVISCPLNAQRRLWSDWADAQADLSLHWAHTHFVGFVMSRLTYDPCYHVASRQHSSLIPCKGLNVEYVSVFYWQA